MGIIIRLAVPVVRALLSRLPVPWVRGLVLRFPKLYVALPPGIRMRFDRFLGDLTVEVDTTYPVERGMLSGRYDTSTLAIIRRTVRPGDWCLDIGANVGAIAMTLAKQVGPRGRVLAFEPGILTYDRMVANLALNPSLAGIVEPLCLGLSDREGRLFWHEHAANRGSANLSAEDGPGAVPVRVATLDGYLGEQPLSRLDFVKIDVESMELEVILGGMETWRKFMPILYYETLAPFEGFRGKPVLRMIEEALKPLGYAFFRQGRAGRLEETAYPDLGHNTLALPPGRRREILGA